MKKRHRSPAVTGEPDTHLRLQGIAAALAVLSREYSMPYLAGLVLRHLQITIADLKAARAAPYDLAALRDAPLEQSPASMRRLPRSASAKPKHDGYGGDRLARLHRPAQTLAFR